MSDKYYQGLRNSLNDVKNKLHLASMTLKINENKNNINGIKNDISGINNFSDKINDNETNISNNLTKINDNETNISNNLTKINDNETNISDNLGKINEIKSNLSHINFDSNNKYSIENFFIYNIGIEKNYNLNKGKRNFSIFKYTLEDDSKIDSILEIDCRLLYQYTNYNNIGLLQHIFKLYDSADKMFYNYKSLKTNAGDNRLNDIKQNDMFYVKLNDYSKIIKIELILSLIDSINNATVDCKIYNAYDSNFMCIKHYKKINLISVNNNLGDLENTILTNKNNISTNLINIRANEDNIAYNLSEINNISKSYLKDIYNVLFYDEKTQINFKGIFYEKIFTVNAKQNDFIEINFKMLLEYENINEKKLC